jgi:hypothetical protein
MQDNQSLLTDTQWNEVGDTPCRVIDFIPLSGSIKNGKVISIDKTTPYASVVIECKELTSQATGFITNRLDFANLWTLFKNRGIREGEEVIIFWRKNKMKGYAKLVASFMPKFWIMVCHKNTYDIANSTDMSPENIKGVGLAIEDWKPDSLR